MSEGIPGSLRLGPELVGQELALVNSLQGGQAGRCGPGLSAEACSWLRSLGRCLLAKQPSLYSVSWAVTANQQGSRVIKPVAAALGYFRCFVPEAVIWS